MTHDDNRKNQVVEAQRADHNYRAMALAAIEHGLSIEWCAEYGIPEVAARMCRTVGDAWAFQQSLKRAARAEIERLESRSLG